MKEISLKNKLIIIVILLFVLIVPLFFDMGLSVGFLVLVILSSITFFVLYKLGFSDKKIYLLFLIVLIIHLGATLFMHYTNFQPFSGGRGDYSGYQKASVILAQRFRQGDFSLNNLDLNYPELYVEHYYPVVVGTLYALTIPEEILGLILNVWLAAITIIFIYLIVLEIGCSKKSAFMIGIIASIYPSYIFNSGLLLKDTIVICFTILGLLFLIKTIKKFTWYNFLVLYLSFIAATHFRFYIGYALIITFVLSWFLISRIDFKKRIVYGIIFIIILGFVPQISSNQGYYGANSFKLFLNSKTISFYRQSVYNPTTYIKPVSTEPVSTKPASTEPVSTKPVSMNGLDSSFTIAKGPVGYVESFSYVLLGPFPWQIKYLRQSLALIETIPWYLLLFFIVDGIIVCFKGRIKAAMPLLIFSIIIMVVVAVFDSNFGLIVRIRIPAFMSLLCLSSLSFDKLKYLNGFNWFKKNSS